MPDVVFSFLRRWRANTLVSGGGTIDYTACELFVKAEQWLPQICMSGHLNEKMMLRPHQHLK